jgi:hypothetical protein
MPWARASLIAQGRRGVVRWEGQFLSTTGISEVNRRLVSLLLDDKSLHLEMRTMYDKNHVVRREENNRVFGRILATNRYHHTSGWRFTLSQNLVCVFGGFSCIALIRCPGETVVAPSVHCPCA